MLNYWVDLRRLEDINFSFSFFHSICGINVERISSNIRSGIKLLLVETDKIMNLHYEISNIVINYYY